MTSTPQPRPFDPHTLLPDLLLYCAQKSNRRRWIPFSELSLHPSLADHPPDRLRAAVRLLAAGWMLEDYRESDTAFRTSGLTQLGILRADGFSIARVTNLGERRLQKKFTASTRKLMLYHIATMAALALLFHLFGWI